MPFDYLFENIVDTRNTTASFRQITIMSDELLLLSICSVKFTKFQKIRLLTDIRLASSIDAKRISHNNNYVVSGSLAHGGGYRSVIHHPRVTATDASTTINSNTLLLTHLTVLAPCAPTFTPTDI